MARPPERNYAPYCDHAFTVVNVRWAYHTALDIVEDLRAAHDGDYYVSDPYDLSGAWVFALCSGCKRSVGQRRASVLDRRRAEKTVLKTPCNALTSVAPTRRNATRCASYRPSTPSRSQDGAL